MNQNDIPILFISIPYKKHIRKFWVFCHVASPCLLLLRCEACTNAALGRIVRTALAVEGARPVEGAAATHVVVSCRRWRRGAPERY